MTNICLVNDVAISDADMATMVIALQGFCDQVTKAWEQPSVKVTTTPTPGAWLIHLTEKKRVVGALGYHTVEGGIPAAYVSLKAVSGKLWGKFYKAMVVKGKVIHDAIYSQGLVTVIAHEVAEMLCDPAIAALSAKDALGRNWLVEVCDHCSGVFSLVTVNSNLCVLPDVTVPSFYDIKGKGPYTLCNSVTAPFTMTPKGYGYWKDASGKLIKL